MSTADESRAKTTSKDTRREHPQQEQPAAVDPNKCPLFCCFYAVFDNKRGPVVAHQYPKGFMEQDVRISTSDIHQLLSRAFAGGRENPAAADESDNNNHPTIRHGANYNNSGSSIFQSTKEYCITGSELSDKTITLSTHELHIMTRPTFLRNEERYERNSLFFSVGFVLRRAADPRPFRPLLSQLAASLQQLELEANFLSSSTSATPPSSSSPACCSSIQDVLHQVVLSLNNNTNPSNNKNIKSKHSWECNLLLNDANALNLKLFHPPKAVVSPVHDHNVPILLVRQDLQLLQLYEWDLAINWVVLHMDGQTTVQQISQKAQVDLEMVRACLRVLKHHGVIALVDMFLYSNRYEFTHKATRLLAGKDPRLLSEALEFALRSHQRATASSSSPRQSSSHVVDAAATDDKDGAHAERTEEQSTQQQSSSIPRETTTFSVSPSASSYPPSRHLLAGSQMSSSVLSSSSLLGPRSFENNNHHHLTSTSTGQPAPFLAQSTTNNEQRSAWTTMMAELYCSCTRQNSFCDLWLSLTNRNSSPKPNQGATKTTSPSDSGTVDTTEDGRKNSSSVPTSWLDFFKAIDHSRFITFGIIHGLIVRVHCFPFLVRDHHDMESVTYRPVDMTASVSQLQSRNQSSSHNTNHLLSTRYVPKKLGVGVVDTRLDPAIVARWMDGRKCDDELVCRFETPLPDLIALVEERYPGTTVETVFSTVAH